MTALLSSWKTFRVRTAREGRSEQVRIAFIAAATGRSRTKGDGSAGYFPYYCH